MLNHQQRIMFKVIVVKKLNKKSQGVSIHGKPGKEFHFSFSRPGKVMEFDSRFWKIHKSHGYYKVASCEIA